MKIEMEHLHSGVFYYILQNISSKARWIILFDKMVGDMINVKGYVGCNKIGIKSSSSDKIGAWGRESDIKEIRLASLAEVLWFQKNLNGSSKEPIPTEKQSVVNDTYFIF